MKLSKRFFLAAACLALMTSCDGTGGTSGGGGGGTPVSKAWGTAALLELSSQTASSPDVAADPDLNGSADGTVTAVWVQSDGSQDSIYATRYNSVTGAWSTPVTIEDESTGSFAGGAYGPRVAMNKYGQAAVLWGYTDGASNYRVWSNRYDNGAWDTAIHTSSTSGNANSPQVSFDASGDAVFSIWAQYQFGSTRYNYRILQRQYLYARCPDPLLVYPACIVADPTILGWRSMSMIDSHDIGDAGEPQIAAWGTRNAVAVWTQNVLGGAAGNEIWANVATSGTWATPVRVNAGSVASAAAPVVAVDSTGSAVAAWLEFVAGRQTFFASRYNGTSWSSPVQIDDSAAGPAVYQSSMPSKIRVVMDASGNALFVWLQENAGRTNTNVHARRCASGPLSGCAAPVLIENSEGYPNFPDLALGPNGDAIAVWKQADGAVKRIYANHYTAASTSWNADPSLVGGSDTPWGEGPQIAIDGNGDATAVWTEFGNIFVNRFE